MASKDDVLLELMTAFQIEHALVKQKWAVSHPGLVQTGQFLRGHRAGVTLTVYYQQAPAELAEGSIYRAVQRRIHSKRLAACGPTSFCRSRRPLRRAGSSWKSKESNALSNNPLAPHS